MLYIDKECLRCNACAVVCPEDAIKDDEPIYVIIESKCTECGKCVEVCPVNAIKQK